MALLKGGGNVFRVQKVEIPSLPLPIPLPKRKDESPQLYEEIASYGNKMRTTVV